MHFSALVTGTIPEIREEKHLDIKIANQIKEIKQEIECGKEGISTTLVLMTLEGRQNAFAREVCDLVDAIMEPYCECTEDPRYLHFEDHTKALRDEYEHGTVDCIKLPQGTIVEANGYPYWGRFFIRDGKVYEKNKGRMHLPKRSKSAKKMKALPSYPNKKLYKTFHEFAEDIRGYSYNKETNGYGYFYNPNGMWDWYQIGGRWPKMFLVKESCLECSIGERRWDSEHEAPSGYKWVAAARKMDIEWQVMCDWKHEKTVKAYYMFKNMFEEQKLPEDFYGSITSEGITYFGDYYFYKGETEAEYIKRNGVPDDWKYPVILYDIINEGEWITYESIPIDINGVKSDIDNSWHTTIDKYFDSLDEDTVLIGVDYHR